MRELRAARDLRAQPARPESVAAAA